MLTSDPVITTAEFQRVEMLVGRVLAAEEFPNARKPSYRLIIDLGAMGTRVPPPEGGGNLNQQHCRSAAEDLRNSGTGTI